jgi:hypothetical protein
METAYSGEPYIEVWNGRVVVGLSVRTDKEYTVKRATNWHELEVEARTILKSMETPAGATVFPCPPQLASRATFTEDSDTDWISIARASRLSGLSHDEINDAIKRGFLEFRILFPSWHAENRGKGTSSQRSMRMVRRSQMNTVWSFPLRMKLRWLTTEFGAAEETYLAARFWKKAQVAGREECWTWQAGRSSGGYGVYWEDGKSRAAHRVAYRMAHGEMPEDRQIAHTCGDKLCVNPLHLVLKD